MQEFTIQVIEIIQNIPQGKVSTYGTIAKMAGSPRGARQVVRILHTMTGKYNLPWHRVINSKGQIAFSEIEARENQAILLTKEGVEINENHRINLEKYMWIGE